MYSSRGENRFPRSAEWVSEWRMLIWQTFVHIHVVIPWLLLLCEWCDNVAIIIIHSLGLDIDWGWMGENEWVDEQLLSHLTTHPVRGISGTLLRCWDAGSGGGFWFVFTITVLKVNFMGYPLPPTILYRRPRGMVLHRVWRSDPQRTSRRSMHNN